ncbi:hypothetical protein JHK82_016357 [Glycine max]|nr:hypothetical protein JHK82_016357 [Glycine max]
MAAWKKLAILGKGSYATVYLATVALPQECNEKVVAVKSSSPFSFSIASMQKEKRILDSFLGCKEILQCYFDQFTVERNYVTYNLFMECAPYGSLLGLVNKKGPISDSEVESTLIADFGLSKTREDANAEYGKVKFRGTPFYMSPESVVGQIEPALDIWSLGCIVIEMITGFRAWKNLRTQKEIMFKLVVLQEAPEIPNGLSWDCTNFLSKCFVKDPRQRWTATMLLNHPFLYPTCYMRSSSFFSYDIVSHVPFKV